MSSNKCHDFHVRMFTLDYGIHVMKAEITAEKDEYIKEKKEQFRLVDMRKQYADIIAEAEQEKIEKYEIKNPTFGFNRMCKKPVLAVRFK